MNMRELDDLIDEWPNLRIQNVFSKMSKTQGEVRWLV